MFSQKCRLNFAEAPATLVDSMARSAAAEVRGDHGLRPGPFAKNASRDTHRMIRRLGRYWKIPITELQFPILGNKGAHVESLSVPYINPVDLFSFFLANHPEAVWGGFSEPHEASSLLTSWWDGFKAVQPSHVAFAHHAGSLGETIPILLYGDEGRGRRRGNTAICSIEVPFGLETARTTRGGAGCACFCDSAGLPKLREEWQTAPAQTSRSTVSLPSSFCGFSLV